MNREQLWVRAREDAGFSEDQAVWREIAGVVDLTATIIFAANPGEEMEHQDLVTLDESDQAWAHENEDKLRVVTYRDVTDAAALACMRWGTEYTRLSREQRNAMGLILLTHKAQEDRVRAAGAGSASYHHVAPEQRQSQAAAAALVTEVFGPQVGELRGVFGSLFRPTPVEPDALFSRRAVAFAAFHREDLERFTEEDRDDLDIEVWVSHADPEAWGWWNTLVSDDAFTRLSRAAPVVMPTREETAEAGVGARDLWLTAVDLYDRGERRALTLLVGD